MKNNLVHWSLIAIYLVTSYLVLLFIRSNYNDAQKTFADKISQEINNSFEQFGEDPLRFKTTEYVIREDDFVGPTIPPDENILCEWIHDDGKSRLNLIKPAGIRELPGKFKVLYAPLKTNNQGDQLPARCGLNDVIGPNLYLYIKVDEFYDTDKEKDYADFLNKKGFDYLTINISTQKNIFDLLLIVKEGDKQPTVYDEKKLFDSKDKNGKPIKERYKKPVEGLSTSLKTIKGDSYFNLILPPKYFYFELKDDPDPNKDVDQWQQLVNNISVKVTFHDYDQLTQQTTSYPVETIGEVKETVVINRSYLASLDLENQLQECVEINIDKKKKDWVEYAGFQTLQTTCPEEEINPTILKKYAKELLNATESNTVIKELQAGSEIIGNINIKTPPVDEKYETYLYAAAMVLFIMFALSFYLAKQPMVSISNQVVEISKKHDHFQKTGEITLEKSDKSGPIHILSNALLESMKQKDVSEKLRAQAEKEKLKAEEEKLRYERISVSSRERARANEDTIYVLNHEIKNFITAVYRNSKNEQLRNRASFARKYMEEIQNMTVENTELTTITESWQKTKLSKLIKNCEITYANRADLNIITEIDESVDIGVFCEEERVQQILDKFIENALERRDPENSPVVIGVDDKPINGFSSIFVHNQVKTFDILKINRAFRPVNSRQVGIDKEGHSGIGLGMARALAISMGGKTSVMRTKSGVSFILHLQNEKKAFDSFS